MKVGPKLLFLDTENAPNIACTWGIHDQKIFYTDIIYEWFFLSGQWSWDDSKQINSVSLLDDKKRFKKNFRDDYHVVKTIWDLLNEADIVIGHHLKGHDLKKLQAKFIEHGLPPVKMPMIVDTYVWAKQFGFTSKKLRDLCTKLELTHKLSHEPGLFIKAALGNPLAIKNIVTYGLGDIPTLRELYYKLKPHSKGHPNHNLFRGDGVECCPKCSSENFKKDGFKYTSVGKKQGYKCKDCGHFFTDGKSIKKVRMR